MLRAHIDAAMDGPRDRNIFGAFALMISDDIVRASSSRAPEAGPAASALALLAHKPGLSIRMLAVGVGPHTQERFVSWTGQRPKG